MDPPEIVAPGAAQQEIPRAATWKCVQAEKNVVMPVLRHAGARQRQKLDFPGLTPELPPFPAQRRPPNGTPSRHAPALQWQPSDRWRNSPTPLLMETSPHPYSKLPWNEKKWSKIERKPDIRALRTTQYDSIEELTVVSPRSARR
jgi:hypothetical protein